MKLDVVKLTRQLVSFPSESQTSNVEVTECIADVLNQLNFEIERLPYVDKNGVDKISIVGRLGKGSGGLSLMSHDDVVPALPEQYKPKLTGGKLYGRGSCDMKGPLAATLCSGSFQGC